MSPIQNHPISIHDRWCSIPRSRSSSRRRDGTPPRDGKIKGVQIVLVRTIVPREHVHGIGVDDRRVAVPCARCTRSAIAEYFSPGHGREVKRKEAIVSGLSIETAMDVKRIGESDRCMSVTRRRRRPGVGGG